MKYNIPLPAVPFAISSVKYRSEGFSLLIEGRADNCAVAYVPDDRNFVQCSSKKRGERRNRTASCVPPTPHVPCLLGTCCPVDPHSLHVQRIRLTVRNPESSSAIRAL